MVKRCIGIDIGSSYLCAVQMVSTAEELCIEKVFSTLIRRGTDSPPDILRLLFSQYGFDRRTDIAIAMPHNAVFFRNLEGPRLAGTQTESAGLEKIPEQSSSVLEHNFPIQPDGIVAQVCSYRQAPGENYSVLTAAATRTSLHERLKIFTEAKMHPSLVETAIFAIHSTVVVNHPEIMTGRAIIAYINECSLTLAVTQDSNILIVRSIPIIAGSEGNIESVREQIAEVLSSEAQITWRKIFGADIEQGTKIYLVTTDKVSDYLAALLEEDLHCQATTVDPYAKVKTPTDHKSDFPICVAEGLALRVLAPEQTQGTNFLEADNANVKPTLDLKKELVICAALVGAIVLFSLVGLFVRLSYLEANYADIKDEITEVFQAVLPEEKNIVSPLVQLEQRLESFRKDYQLFASFSPTGLGPLEVLHNISANTPSQADMKVDDLLITADAVRVNGTCDSFESVYQWQRLLQEVPGFTLVDVPDVQKQPDTGLVQFTMLLSSAIQEKE